MFANAHAFSHMRVRSRLLLLAALLGILAVFAGIFIGAFSEAPLFGIADFKPVMLTAIIPGACACLLAIVEMLRTSDGATAAPTGRWYAGSPLSIIATGLLAIAAPFVMGLVAILFVVVASL